MIYVLLRAKWAHDLEPHSIQGEFSPEEVAQLNALGYNVYYYPNAPLPETYASLPVNPRTGEKRFIRAKDITKFDWIFADLDMKDFESLDPNRRHGYPTKEAFIETLAGADFPPTRVVDSGGGVHAYWRVTDLDAMSYLRLQRRIARKFKTDPAVAMIKQLMRLPGTMNMKSKDGPVPCELLFESTTEYTCEDLDKVLPPITQADEDFCQEHYAKAYDEGRGLTKVDDKLPVKFAKLIKNNREVKDIWAGNVDDRSKGDWRLAHILFASGFTRAEALSVLVNASKALERAPIHRVGYAEQIVDKIWTYEAQLDAGEKPSELAESVADILSKGDNESLKGTRFPCYHHYDGTEHGFRLGQVIGLSAGVGVGKTAIALNMFKGFVEFNPDYVHFFVPLEQPAREIADRWQKMCGSDTRLHSKVHVLSNYNADGSYRNLSLDEIQDYILDFQVRTGLKVGCVCLDHIGVLKKETRNGENQGLMDLCSSLKAFAISTNTLFIVQTQTNREKAGIGDLELFKDAAYGTQHFESFVDFLMVAWQPLKRCYDNPQCPRVTAYKFAKIRFKSRKDSIVEDQCYRLVFDDTSQVFRPFVQADEASFAFFNSQATNLRKKDRKTDILTYKSIPQKDEAKR